MNAPIDWLLEGAAWIEYRTRRDLLGESELDPKVKSARMAMLADDQVKKLVRELADWPGEVLTNHKRASLLIHKLTFVADLGLNMADPGIDTVVTRIMAHQSTEGPFQVVINLPTHFGGTGRDQWTWALCDAPLLVYALVKFGLKNNPQVQAAINYLVGLVRENGWPCAASPELGKFHGPGRREDPCPYANLAMLKALSAIEELQDDEASHIGAETLLSLWSESISQHPYLFHMGTDFRKLKLPFVWYDILHVLEVLSHYTWLRKDARLLEMLDLIKNKADEQGRFSPESIWTTWKDWEFGQKREPSRWLSLLAWRIMGRIEPVPDLT